MHWESGPAIVLMLSLILVSGPLGAQRPASSATSGTVSFTGYCHGERVDTLAAGVIPSSSGPVKWALLCGQSLRYYRDGNTLQTIEETSRGTFWLGAELVNRGEVERSKWKLSVTLLPNKNHLTHKSYLNCTRPQYGGRSVNGSGALTLTVAFSETAKEARSSICPILDVFVRAEYSVGQVENYYGR